MSEKYDQFVQALEALCREHRVQLSISTYDTLDIWELCEEEHPIYASAIRDMTTDTSRKKQ